MITKEKETLGERNFKLIKFSKREDLSTQVFEINNSSDGGELLFIKEDKTQIIETSDVKLLKAREIVRHHTYIVVQYHDAR